MADEWHVCETQKLTANTACAVYLSDEETCVAVARFFMREYAFSSDSYRMFATLCRMSHSPISWYSSGPAQKYILRQIKAMDVPVLASEQYGFSGGPRGAGEEQRRIDICLLMLYGHILFTSTSYTYALSKSTPPPPSPPCWGRSRCLVSL